MGDVTCPTCSFTQRAGFPSCSVCGSALPDVSPQPDHRAVEIPPVLMQERPQENSQCDANDASSQDSNHNENMNNIEPIEPPTKRRRTMEADDASLARRLQKEEEHHAEKRKEEEQQAMYHGESGRAFLLVEKVLKLYETILQEDEVNNKALAARHNLKAVGRDDMVFLAENMINCQAKFQQEGKPIAVEVGYHYTVEERIHSIRQDGLLTRTHAKTNKHKKFTTRHGAVYGDGVYTGDNPYAFRIYGDMGLLVAVLKGKTQTIKSSDLKGMDESQIDTKIGNKFRKSSSAEGMDEIVLSQSAQILPLIRYSKTLISDDSGSPGSELLWRFHVEIQKLLDEIFNNATPVVPVRVVPSRENMQRLAHSFSRGQQGLAVRKAILQYVLTYIGPGIDGELTKLVQTATTLTPSALMFGDFGKRLKSMVGEAHFAKLQQVAINAHRVTRAQTNEPPSREDILSYLKDKDPAMHEMAQKYIRTRGRNRSDASLARSMKMIVGEEHWQNIQQFAQNQNGQPPTQQQHLMVVGGELVSVASQSSSARQQAVANPETREGNHQSKRVPFNFVVPKAPRIVALHTVTADNPQASNRVRASGHDVVNGRGAPSSAVAAAPNPTPPDLKGTRSYNLELYRKRKPDQSLRQMPATAMGSLMNSSNSHMAVGRATTKKKAPLEHPPTIEPTDTKPSRVTRAYEGMIYYQAPTTLQPNTKQGLSPSGTMGVKHIMQACSGFESCSKGSFAITYSLPDGRQQAYHEIVGKKYKGTTRVAFLPNNDRGKACLRRLKWAWSRGLIFTIGTSLTLGNKSGRIVWSSIPHKTGLVTGERSFPDPDYFDKCNAHLNALGVPDSSQLTCTGSHDDD